MQEERDTLREELLNKKEPGPENIENSLPLQMAKDDKIKRFTVKRACSRKKAEGVTLPPFAESWESYQKVRIFIHKRLGVFLTSFHSNQWTSK